MEEEVTNGSREENRLWHVYTVNGTRVHWKAEKLTKRQPVINVLTKRLHQMLDA